MDVFKMIVTKKFKFLWAIKNNMCKMKSLIKGRQKQPNTSKWIRITAIKMDYVSINGACFTVTELEATVGTHEISSYGGEQ